MKLEIIGSDGRPCQVWLNFHNEHIGWDQKNDVIAEYSGRFVFHGSTNVLSHLEFDDEKSATAFLLRWA